MSESTKEEVKQEVEVKPEAAKSPGRPSKPVTLINKTKGLRRVLGRKILPDDNGIEISKEEFEQLKKGKAFSAQLESGEFEVK